MALCLLLRLFVFRLFFFTSRRPHTRYWRDWSSDVCSSDLNSSQSLCPLRPLRLKVYSYLSAATGSRRDAVQAGAKPENKPVSIETIMLRNTKPTEKWIGKDGNALPIPKHIR